MTVRMTNRVVPGVGISQEIALHDGHHLVVTTRHDGAYDIASDGGPFRLEEAEADTLAALLGTAKLVKRLSSVRHVADSLLVEQLPLPMHSPYAGDPLSATRIRGRTGASIVAIVRDGGVQPSPKPEYVLDAGDLLVAVGTREALDQVARILDGTG